MEDKLGLPPPNMSKMPAKKKSCFQITSVTQAQVAAVGAADDSESLDDPDESRTEDVSSEIYDVSRAEYEPACDRSSSEEALNNVGEAEVSAVAPSNAPQASQSGLVCNPVGDVRKTGVSGSSQGGQNSPTGSPLTTQPHVSVSTSAAATSPAPAATSTVSCSSRFRVIKLDHGTGEPFRRGRWTCTEFYEKESDPLLGGRTVDSIRHPSVTQDPTADRDSGLGPSVGSVVSPVTHTSPVFGSMAEVSHASSRLHSAETLPQQQVLHQSYTAQQHGVGASATHTSFSSIKSTAAPAPSTVGVLQPHLAQNVLPVGQNGLPHSDVHLQKSPIMPPLYPPQQQVPLGHHMTSQSTGMMQTEYYQQQQSTPVPAALSGVQSLPVSSLSAGTVGQAPAPALSLASGVASVPSQVGDVSVAPLVSVSAGQPALAALQQQTVGILVAGSGVPLQTAGQFPSTGLPLPSGVQNVPAMAVGASVPTAVLSASSAAMPNVSTFSLPPSQMPHSITPVTRGVQGLPVIGFGQAEGAGGGRKSEGLIDAQSPGSGREMVKPFMPDTLNLNTPTVNSLFGIHIPVDGDEDRNPSMAFYQAFQSGSRLRDSKVHTDSASGANIVAIDNKIEQAMDLVKSHLMYAVREEVEVLKEQIKELFERNSVLERENAVLKSLANSEQLSQLSSQAPTAAPAATPSQQGLSPPQLQQQHPKPQQLQTPQPQTQLDAGQQPNVTSA